MVRVITTGVLLALLASGALAQDRVLTVQPFIGLPHRPVFGVETAGVGVDSLPTPFSAGGSCIKMCKYDEAPCDPDYWKVADRRCNYNQRR